MNLLKYLLYITFVFFLLSCLHLSNKKIYIENECKNFFPKKDYNDYIIGEDKKKLEEITDINEYIDILYKLIKKKTIPTTKYFSHYNESAYDFGTVYKKLINYYHEDNNDKNIILKIIIEINNKPDADYISGYTRGLFKTYYILLEKMKENVSLEIVNKFIKSLPDLKLLILAEYKELIDFNIKPDINAYYQAYMEVNKENYQVIFSNKKIFPSSTKKIREKYIENIGYYFKLQKFIE